MPKDGNFGNRSMYLETTVCIASVCATSGTFANGQVSCSNMAIFKVGISEIASRRAKISSIWTPWGRTRVCLQLRDLLSVAKFHAQILQFWRLVHIMETAVRGVKISSILTPWGRKGVCVQLLDLFPFAEFHAQLYGNFEKGPISPKLLPLEQNKPN